MKRSIRQYLIIRLLSSIVLITILSSITYYFLDKKLGDRFTLDSIYILIFSCPLMGLVIWFTVGNAMNTLQRVATEVSQRAPHFLDPVDLNVVPQEIKPLVNELNKLFLRLRQGFEREKSFSANAAHELRTPLAALKTQAQAALKATPEEQTIALEKLILIVDRASHVVLQLLTLSRIVPEIALQNLSPLNLSTLATDVVATLAPSAIEKNIEIELFGGEANIMVNGISTAISILVRNIVDNAIRYTPEGGFIQVFVEKNEHIHIRVIDNGPGIPPELRSQVFERFYRILGTKNQGSGLGLAIVQQIASLHKAEVTLDAPDNGMGLEVRVNFNQ